MRHLRLFVLLVVALVITPRGAPAQADSASLHATVHAWAERTWLQLLDRSAVPGGRLGDGGILQRFHEDIDAEYELDLISSRFGLTEEYDWYRRENGLRYWGGSINYLQLVSGAEVKARSDLGRGWSVQALFEKEDAPNLHRNLLRIRFRKDWRHGPYLALEGDLHPRKPESDISVTGGWRTATGDARVTLTALDAFNDFIYRVLEVWPGFADTAIDHERANLAVRAQIERTLAPGVRVELDAGVLLPFRLRAYRQRAPDEGFRQDERFAMAAGMVEAAVTPRVRLGVFGRWVRAVSDRRPLAAGRALDDYRLIERNASAGAFALWDLGTRWRWETWLGRSWRPERRTYRLGVAPDVDYEDRAWSGQSALRYAAPSGFTSAFALEMDLREVVRGDRAVPALQSLDDDNVRVRLDFGWRLNQRFAAAVGSRWDLDGDSPTKFKLFDGAHGRFTLYW